MPDERSLRRHAFPRLTALADAFWVGAHKRAPFVDFRRVALRIEEAEAAVAAAAAAAVQGEGEAGRRAEEEEEDRGREGLHADEEEEPAHLAEGSCVRASLRSYLDGAEGAHHPDKAIDGDGATFWWSEGAPQPGDSLSVRYARPREACGVRALTGSADGRDRCRGCRVRVCVAETTDDEAAAAVVDGACVPRDVGRVGADGSLSARLDPPARVRQVELRCEVAQHEWLIVRELGVQPCQTAAGGAAPRDEGTRVHHEEL